MVNFTIPISMIMISRPIWMYDGWFGLDLFPYRDDTQKFMDLSRDNLRLAQQVVKLMNEKGAAEMRAEGTKGIELSRLMLESIQEAK